MTVRYGYQPMHPPEKHVSQDRMAEILAKRAQPKVVVTPSAPAPRPPLEWEKPEKYYCKSKCGRYQVTKVYNGTIASYEIWKLSPDTVWFAHLKVGLPTFEAAKGLAQQDSEK